jgi:hypothetical protein
MPAHKAAEPAAANINRFQKNRISGMKPGFYGRLPAPIAADWTARTIKIMLDCKSVLIPAATTASRPRAAIPTH